MSSDPHDKVQDARAEAAHDGIELSTADVVRLTLAFEADHGHYYRKLSPFARHPFGLPTVAASPGDTPAGLHAVSSPAGVQPGGHHLPDIAA